MKTKIFPLIVLISGIWSLIINQVPIIDFIFLISSTIFTFFISANFSLKENLSKYVVLITYWISLQFIAGLHLIDASDAIKAQDYSSAFSFGIKIYFIATLTWLIVSRNKKKNQKDSVNIQYLPVRINDSTINFLFFVITGLSLFSWSIGLSKMGAEAVALPFGLGGIINLTRSILFPILFAIIVENRIIRKESVNKKYYFLFFSWSLIEVLVRLSKSVLLLNFVYVLVVLYLYYNPSTKTIVRVATPLLVVFLFLYPVIGMIRVASLDGESIQQSIKFATNEVSSNNESDGSFLLTPLNRTFMTADMYIKDISYIENKDLFDFSNIPLLFVSGGASGFQTFIIDGYSEDSHHSSGTTGIMDSLLHGGRGLCYLFVCLFVFIGSLIDKLYKKGMFSIYVVLMYLLWLYTNEQNISNAYTILGFQYLFFYSLAIFIAYRLNFKNMIISKND